MINPFKKEKISDKEAILSFNKEYSDKGAYIDPVSGKKIPGASPNMILSKHMQKGLDFGKTITNNNVLLIGEKGAMCPEYFIKPNILQLNSSFILPDPSGEILESVGNVLKNNGYKINVLDLSCPADSPCHYNPLTYVGRDDRTMEDAVSSLLVKIFENTDGLVDENEKTNKMKTNAVTFLMSCIFHLLDLELDPYFHTFSAVFDMANMALTLSGPTPLEKDTKYKVPYGDYEKLFTENDPCLSCTEDDVKKNLAILLGKDPEGSRSRKYYEIFQKEAGKDAKNVIYSCIKRLRVFAQLPVRNLTRTDDLGVRNMGDKKTALFLVASAIKDPLDFFVPVLFAQATTVLIDKGDEKKEETGSQKLPYPVSFYFYNLSRYGSAVFLNNIFYSLLRPRNIHFIFYAHSLQDIKGLCRETENEGAYKTLAANCDTVIFYGSSDPETIGFFSGYEKDEKRAKDIADMPAGRCMVYVRGGTRPRRKDISKKESNEDTVTFAEIESAPLFDDIYPYGAHVWYQDTFDGGGDPYQRKDVR